MTGFEPQSSGVGSDRSTNCATTTAYSDYSLVQFSVLQPPLESFFSIWPWRLLWGCRRDFHQDLRATFSDFFRQRLFWRNKKFCAKSRVWRWHFREKAVATFDLGYIVLINKTLISSFTNWLYCHENRYQLLQKRFTAKSFDLCVNLQRFRSEKVFLVYKRYILTYLLNAYLIVRPMKICNFKLNNN